MDRIVLKEEKELNFMFWGFENSVLLNIALQQDVVEYTENLT